MQDQNPLENLPEKILSVPPAGGRNSSHNALYESKLTTRAGDPPTMEKLKNEPSKADAPTVPALASTPSVTVTLPAVIATEGPEASERFFTFFTDTIRNPNTREAYLRNACRF